MMLRREMERIGQYHENGDGRCCITRRPFGVFWRVRDIFTALEGFDLATEHWVDRRGTLEADWRYAMVLIILGLTRFSIGLMLIPYRDSLMIPYVKCRVAMSMTIIIILIIINVIIIIIISSSSS